MTRRMMDKSNREQTEPLADGELLTTKEAVEYLGAYPDLFKNIRKRMPSFPCHRGPSTRTRLKWGRRELDLMRRLHAIGVNWEDCAKIVAECKITDNGFII